MIAECFQASDSRSNDTAFTRSIRISTAIRTNAVMGRPQCNMGFLDAMFYQSKWLWTWTVPFSLYNIKRDCWSVRPQLLQCMPRAVHIVLGPQPQMDWPPRPQMDLSTDPQHLYLQRSALEASFPPAKANLLPQATAEEQPCSEEKNTKKPHH